MRCSRKKLLKSRTLLPDDTHIRVVVLLLLMLCNKPFLRCTTTGVSSEDLLLSRKSASKPSIHRHRYSDHRAPRQALQWNLLAQRGSAQTSRGHVKQGRALSSSLVFIKKDRERLNGVSKPPSGRPRKLDDDYRSCLIAVCCN
ncbi:hypothetical protein N7501_011583 [Penicillium viridicatum]|nr:hypothetical protein N7501_011583 [Penicillium viridicatum]